MKEIIGFPMYTLHENGTVYSKFIKGGTGKTGDKLSPLKPVIDNTGYPIVSLINEFGKYKKSIHRLLAEHFIPNPENKDHVNHIDADKTNYQLTNLEWASPKENYHHAKFLDLIPDQPTKAVRQINLENRQMISEFNSLAKAQKETGIPYPNIIKVCKGLRKQAGGYFWEYV